jgi:hypothetical protein
VLADHARREVDVEVAGQPANGVGGPEVGLFENLLAGTVPFDDQEPLVPGAFCLLRVVLYEGHLVTLLLKDAGGAQSDPS